MDPFISVYKYLTVKYTFFYAFPWQKKIFKRVVQTLIHRQRKYLSINLRYLCCVMESRELSKL